MFYGKYYEESCPSVSNQCNDDALREELRRFGFNPGPIVDSTRSFYKNKLATLKRGTKCENVDNLSDRPKHLKVKHTQPKKSPKFDIDKCLRNADWMQDLKPYMKLEKEARADFEHSSTNWANGATKKSFTYLLLDPRITKNLPARTLSKNRQWTTFIDSIFYVGKGKNDRPYKHLNEAIPFWEDFETSKDKKIQYILDIWEDDMGVICLQVFHNVTPDEALTYEAAMIDALDINTLTNINSGSYKGIVATWPKEKQYMLGVYLLYKAMRNYLNEGERQLKPDDI